MDLRSAPVTPLLGTELDGLSGEQLVAPAFAGMLHRALPFEPTSPRLMHRTTLVGVEPVV